MSETEPQPTAVPQNAVFGALSNRRRRCVLRVIDEVSSIRPVDLAAHVVAEETDKPVVDVDRPEAERVLVDLEMCHTPKLVDAGLLARDDGTLTTTQHPAFQDPKIDAVLRTETPGWDAVLDALTDRRRRIALTTLWMNEGPMDRTELAAAVASKVDVNDDRGATVDAVLLDLHHVHLPKLEAAGLVDYDGDGESVVYEGHPGLDEEWLVAGEQDTPRAILSMADRSADIWTLDGRDNVTERGRALCETADDELFMMFTIEGTVETACVRRIRDAVDRGVDVYLGTQNRNLRDLVRENTPEVTIWEPQLDWLNLPPSREKVGRLILADREEIMIGTIGDKGPDGVYRETAITGSGADNPLVMLLREMLGSRLDHLDAQSEDFLSEIPL